MTIADGMSALSEHILLIVFVIKEFEFEKIYNALSTLLSTLLHLATVGLRHSGHVISILYTM